MSPWTLVPLVVTFRVSWACSFHSSRQPACGSKEVVLPLIVLDGPAPRRSSIEADSEPL